MIWFTAYYVLLYGAFKPEFAPLRRWRQRKTNEKGAGRGATGGLLVMIFSP